MWHTWFIRDSSKLSFLIDHKSPSESVVPNRIGKLDSVYEREPLDPKAINLVKE